MPQHPGQGQGSAIGGFGLAGFGIVFPGRPERPRTVVDPLRQLALERGTIGIAAAHLGRQIMGVGVEVALGGQVSGTLLKGPEPAVDGWVPAAQPIAFVVGQARPHPFDVGHEHQISRADLPKQEGSGGGHQGVSHGGGHAIEGLGGLVFSAGPRKRHTQPLAPGLEQQPLQPPQRQNLRILHRKPQRPESLLQGQKNPIALGDQPPVELQRRQHPVGHQLAIPALLLPVADHRDLTYPIRNALLLKPKPHLLAVRTPGVVIAVERHPHR